MVGAGSSGAVLANRLSADPTTSVCLIEAGPEDRSPLISMPLGVIRLAKDKRHNWLFSSTPQAGLAGRTVSVPRGKVLGGSSAINGMIYIRGHQDDYDGWAELGCDGWDYASVLPYFGISVRAAPRLAWDGLRWIFGRRGRLSSNMVEAGGFARTSPTEPRPDIQFHFIPGRKSHRGRMVEYGHGVSLHTCLLRPESRGSITRPSPDGPPAIDLGLLREEADLHRLCTGVQVARSILAQAPFEKYALSEIVPGADARDGEALLDRIRADARTVYHPVGTCAMGTGAEAVTTPRLAVHGVHGLRVVDASIMPRIVSGNTNAPAIMIAEKAADMIRDDRWSRS